MSNCISSKDTVSVIIPTYGDYSGLKQTVDSVLSQNYPIETLILSDDGSDSPFPEDILLELQENLAKYKKLVIRRNDKNLGTVRHLNLTAELCKSTYIKFLACGDAFYNQDSLGDLVHFALESDSMLVTSNALVSSPDLSSTYYLFPGKRRGRKLNRTDSKLFELLARKNLVSAVGTLLRQDFFSVLGGFDMEYHLLEDWPAWLRLAREGNSIPFLNQVTCYYAVGGLSSQNGNAFCTPSLRQDMLLCYKKEILPYLEHFHPIASRTILFNYNQLCGLAEARLWKQFFGLKLMDSIKREIKWIILKWSRHSDIHR